LTVTASLNFAAISFEAASIADSKAAEFVLGWNDGKKASLIVRAIAGVAAEASASPNNPGKKTNDAQRNVVCIDSRSPVAQYQQSAAF
jgi:hypothetical protein